MPSYILEVPTHLVEVVDDIDGTSGGFEVQPILPESVVRWEQATSDKKVKKNTQLIHCRGVGATWLDEVKDLGGKEIAEVLTDLEYDDYFLGDGWKEKDAEKVIKAKIKDKVDEELSKLGRAHIAMLVLTTGISLAAAIILQKLFGTAGIAAMGLPAWGSAGYEDDFNSANTTTLVGRNLSGGAGTWADGNSAVDDFFISSNRISAGDVSSRNILSGTFGNDQAAELKNGGLAQNGKGPGVRYDTSSNGYYLCNQVGAGNYRIYRHDAGLITSIGSYAQAPGDNDLMTISIVGTTINGYLENTLIIGPVTDATHSAGAPAAVAHNNSSRQMDNFKAWIFEEGAATPISLGFMPVVS